MICIFNFLDLNKVIHLIPFDGVGGVERAARSLANDQYGDINFKVDTILPTNAKTKRWALWNPWHYLKIIVNITKIAPDILIVSLWRSYIVGCIVKFVLPSTKLVAFLHSVNHVHYVDKVFTKLACYMADNVWSDSRETMNSHVSGLIPNKSKVISFVTEKIAFQERIMLNTVIPNFIFWGRLHPQKGLHIAIEIIRLIHNLRPGTRFTVIGPDGGDFNRLLTIVKEYQLESVVTFLGPMSFEEIKIESLRASFYLQTSELEGMAMSVLEAMQLGLVPVVTPVGEIANYCSHSSNAILIKDHQQAADDVMNLMDDTALYMKIRSNAIATWCDKSLYKDDVIRACHELLNIGVVQSDSG